MDVFRLLFGAHHIVSKAIRFQSQQALETIERSTWMLQRRWKIQQNSAIIMSNCDKNNEPENDHNRTSESMHQVLSNTEDAPQSNQKNMQNSVAQQQPTSWKVMAKPIVCEDATMNATLFKENSSIKKHSTPRDTNKESNTPTQLENNNNNNNNNADSIIEASDADQKSTSTNSIPQTIASATNSWTPRERRVPSSQVERLLGFGQVGVGLIVGKLTDGLFLSGEHKRSNAPSTSKLGSTLSNRNAERLASGLCRMRGAALKIGQILSIQDESILPPELASIFERVRDQADIMPRRQLEHVLSSELGIDWESKIRKFEWVPIAAASIGQVHRVDLLDGRSAVMKVQYPGVARSINSDIDNASSILSWTGLIPKGLFFDKLMRAAKQELALECDYTYEAQCQRRYKHMLSGYSEFRVPDVIDELSTNAVLTSEFAPGLPIDRVGVGASHEQPQDIRNFLASKFLQLTLEELFVHRFMQTDPNWSNFLYETGSNCINLVDFGASREYAKAFVDEYMRMVYACAHRDREGAIDSSIRMGFLTGDECDEMIDAHVEAGFITGEPFMSDEPYNFAEANIAARVSKYAKIMIKLRLTAPPTEAYTLHRKLSGAFLVCKRLGASISCRDLFMRIYRNYKFNDVRLNAAELKEAIRKDDYTLVHHT